MPAEFKGIFLVYETYKKSELMLPGNIKGMSRASVWCRCSNSSAADAPYFPYFTGIKINLLLEDSRAAATNRVDQGAFRPDASIQRFDICLFPNGADRRADYIPSAPDALSMNEFASFAILH